MAVGSRYRKCRQCGRSGSARYPISARGKCPPCGRRNVREALTQITEGRGPYADKWAARLVQGMARHLEEEAEAS